MSVSFSPNKPIITSVKLCISCKHAIHNSKTPSVVYCRLFGKINVITGDKMYEDCSLVRKDMNKCSVNGVYFESLTPFNYN